MYTDDNINGSNHPCKWGDCESAEPPTELTRADPCNCTLYLNPMNTVFEDGKYYLGYRIPVSVMQAPSSKNAPRLSKTESESSEWDCTSELSDAECTELTHVGKFTGYAGRDGAVKNYGFVQTEELVMNMTRFIVLDVPPECKRGDRVRFVLVPNKRGKDACKAVILEKVGQKRGE